MQETLIQIRHVPQAVHRTLKARAAHEGLSLSDYLLREIRMIAERPTLASLMERVRQREPIGKSLDSVSAVRHEREGRR